MKTKTYIKITSITATDRTSASYFVGDEQAANQIQSIIDNCTDKKTLEFRNQPIEKTI
jgi:hypothetical protein